MKNLLNLW